MPRRAAQFRALAPLLTGTPLSPRQVELENWNNVKGFMGALEKETWPGGWKSRERMIMSKRQPFSVRSLLISGTIDCPLATLSEPTRSHSSVPPRAGGVHTENMSSDDGRLVKHFSAAAGGEAR